MLDGAGRIILVQQKAVSSAEILRLMADGTVDPTFAAGTPLKLPQPDPSDVQIAGVAVDSQGRILVAGLTYEGYGDAYRSRSRAAVWRITGGGEIDAAFGAQGMALLARSGGGEADRDRANGIAIDRLDRPVIVGSTAITVGDQVQAAAAIWRLNP